MKIYIMSGVSGSGKSTYASSLAKPEDLTVVSADHYFMEDGVYRFDPSRLGQAHARCLHNFIAALNQNEREPDHDRVLVVDNTNTTELELAPYVAVSAAYGHRPTLVTVVANLEVAAARNTHGVTLQGVRRQWDNIKHRRKIPLFWQIDTKIVKDGEEVSLVGPDGVLVDLE